MIYTDENVQEMIALAKQEMVEDIVAYMREPDLDSISGHAATKAWADRIEQKFGSQA